MARNTPFLAVGPVSRPAYPSTRRHAANLSYGRCCLVAMTTYLSHSTMSCTAKGFKVVLLVIFYRYKYICASNIFWSSAGNDEPSPNFLRPSLFIYIFFKQHFGCLQQYSIRRYLRAACDPFLLLFVCFCCLLFEVLPDVFCVVIQNTLMTQKLQDETPYHPSIAAERLKVFVQVHIRCVLHVRPYSMCALFCVVCRK